VVLVVTLPDIVIPVRPGDDNEELRYTLRGIAAHVPHRTVWVVGHCPPWVSLQVQHIPVAQRGTRWENSRANRMAACEHPNVAENFLLFNDDFFVLEPVERIPLHHRGTVRQVAGEHLREGRRTEYLAGMRATARFLRECGVDEPLSYELHVPMPCTKRGLATALRVAEDSGIAVPHVRTLYGNLAAPDRPGTFLADVKVADPNQRPPDDALFVSSKDRSFAGALGRWVHERLPDPCRYESAGRSTEVA
jgi:hypothetical protein